MTRQERKRLLQIASDLVPFGIYAVERNNYCELKNESYELPSDLRDAVKAYKKEGYKVHANGL